MLLKFIKYYLFTSVAFMQIKAQTFDYTNIKISLQPKKPIPNMKTAVGTVYDLSGIHSKGTLNFYYNNKEYKVFLSGTDCVRGTKYLVQFDSLNPYNNYVISMQVFLPEEKTAWTIATIKAYDYNFLDFKYEIETNGGKTKRYVISQFVCRGRAKKVHPELRKGMKFKVEYIIDNPGRAIVYLDKPVLEQDSLKK
jgi:hypothetical protein